MKKGFTLAEVLITLGIIGVVAALTIPTLINNYQKKQWVAGLQRGYATLNQVFKTAMAEDLVGDVTQTELYNAIPVNDYGERRIGNPSQDYSAFVEQLKKYLKITKFCNPTDDPLNDPCFGIFYSALNSGSEYSELEKGWHLKIYTADGIVYYFQGLTEYNFKEFGGFLTGAIEIDVNGDAGPNQYGRDLFSFVLLKNGNVIMPGTKSWVENDIIYENDFFGLDPVLNHWSNEDYGSSCMIKTGGGFGDYCGARIFESGWKMDY